MPKPELIRGPVKHTDIDGVQSDVWWIKCPQCQIEGFIDEDQAYGRVSIYHRKCGYHETHNVTAV